jgi:hypothetical protein
MLAVQGVFIGTLSYDTIESGIEFLFNIRLGNHL